MTERLYRPIQPIPYWPRSPQSGVVKSASTPTETKRASRSRPGQDLWGSRSRTRPRLYLLEINSKSKQMINSHNFQRKSSISFQKTSFLLNHFQRINLALNSRSVCLGAPNSLVIKPSLPIPRLSENAETLKNWSGLELTDLEHSAGILCWTLNLIKQLGIKVTVKRHQEKH